MMKKNFILAVFYLIISTISFAQVPQKMSYQAVVRGSDNNLVVNQNVAMRVSILQGSADGTAVYTETHSAQTNVNGLVSIEIGNGTSNGDFASINWANGPYFVKTETNVNGGENFEIVSVSQLLSVPFAMYAQTATESQTLADVVALGNSVNAQLKDVMAPTDNQDAATKKYVDDLIAELQAQNSELQATIYALQAGTIGAVNGHTWIDLGLPSGTKWATCNVGANSPEECGNYYAWGEITIKTDYNSSNYTYTGNPATLPSDRDAATANWGSGWRMPTQAEMQELLDNCTTTWTTQNGVNGRLFIGPNGNSIFLPTNSTYGSCWSSSLYSSGTSNAYCIFFASDDIFLSYSVRYSGKYVRAVLAE